MKLLNHTAWRTDHLKAILNRVAQDELAPVDRKCMTVTVQYRRSNAYHLGCAFYGNKAVDRGAFRLASWNSRRIWLYLERDGMEQSRDQLAHTIAHEFAHTRGLRHRDMAGPRYNWEDGWKDLYAWANDFPLEQKPAREKPSAEAVANLAMVHAGRQVERWLTKVKRAQTILKKWKRKATYYERRAAAARMQP